MCRLVWLNLHSDCWTFQLPTAAHFSFCYESFCEWLTRTINYLINVYSVTFWSLYYWLVHSFFCFLSALLTMYVAAYGSNYWWWKSWHITLVMKKFTTHLSWKPKPNRKPRFFLQNLPKPTDRKHFETVTTLFVTSNSHYTHSIKNVTHWQ